MLEPVTEPVRRLIAKYESRIERLEKANGRLCEQINAMPEIVRCKDCANLNIVDKCPCGFWALENLNGFCAWAERKEVTR